MHSFHLGRPAAISKQRLARFGAAYQWLRNRFDKFERQAAPLKLRESCSGAVGGPRLGMLHGDRSWEEAELFSALGLLTFLGSTGFKVPRLQDKELFVWPEVCPV